MIDFKYIQDNLPPIEVQLELFKYELGAYDDFKFNFVTGIHLVSQEYFTIVDLNKPNPPLDGEKHYWFAECVDWIFISLADRIFFECIKRKVKEVNILLADTYLFPLEEDGEVKIKGVAKIIFS